MKKDIFVSLFLALAFFLTAVEASAVDPCEKLSENACGQLFRAIQEWNDRYGNSVKAIDWKYAGPVDDTKALVKELTDPKNTWVPHQLEGNLVEARQLSTVKQLCPRSDSVALGWNIW